MPRKKSASRSAEVKFTYFFASSLDGFVADAHGGVEWLDAFRTPDRFGEFNAFMSSVDGAVIGRKTYEQALVMTKGGKWPMPKIPCVVLSKTRSIGPHVEFWSEPLAGLAEYFREKGAHNIWMMGGGATAASFLNAGMLTSIRQSVMPIVLGTGIPAYGALENAVRFELAECKHYPNGVVSLSYKPK